MGIILTILKITGILLAVIVGLLLFVVLIVLFVPIRYRLKGSRAQETGEIKAKGSVSWLLSLIHVSFGYEKEMFFRIRLCGIPLKLSGKKTEDEKEEETSESVPDKEEDRTQTEPADKPKVLTTTSLEDNDEPEAKFFDKLRNVLQTFGEKLKGIPDKLRAVNETIGGIPVRIRELKARTDIWIDFIRSDEVKETLLLLWREVKGLFRQILPRKVRIHGRFGFDDPALTGQVTGVLSVMPVFYKKDISVVPDFTGACLEGEFFLRGRIHLVTFLALAWKIWFNPDFKKGYNRFKALNKGGIQNG